MLDERGSWGELWGKMEDVRWVWEGKMKGKIGVGMEVEGWGCVICERGCEGEMIWFRG